jgi:hypothetical protein
MTRDTSAQDDLVRPTIPATRTSENAFGRRERPRRAASPRPRFTGSARPERCDARA